MDRKRKTGPALRRGIAAALILGLGTLLAAGTAWARFETRVEKPLTITAAQTGALSLTAGDWTASEDGWAAALTVTNTGGADLTCRLMLLGSLGLEKSDNLTATLQIGEATYRGTAEAIPEGSALHRTFGDGWCWRFTDEAGQEAALPLQAGAALTGQLIIRPAADFTEAYFSLLRIVAQS